MMRSRSRSRIWPWATWTLASGIRASILRAWLSIVSTSLCRSVVPRKGREALYARWKERFLDEARLLTSLHQPHTQPRLVQVREVFPRSPPTLASRVCLFW